MAREKGPLGAEGGYLSRAREWKTLGPSADQAEPGDQPGARARA